MTNDKHATTDLYRQLMDDLGVSQADLEHLGVLDKVKMIRKLQLVQADAFKADRLAKKYVEREVVCKEWDAALTALRKRLLQLPMNCASVLSTILEVTEEDQQRVERLWNEHVRDALEIFEAASPDAVRTPERDRSR